MREVRIAIAGIRNCASSLVQGLRFYKNRDEREIAGLMHPKIGEWNVGDIEIVTAGGQSR